jgi:hypothetical protein
MFGPAFGSQFLIFCFQHLPLNSVLMANIGAIIHWMLLIFLSWGSLHQALSHVKEILVLQ